MFFVLIVVFGLGKFLEGGGGGGGIGGLIWFIVLMGFEYCGGRGRIGGNVEGGSWMFWNFLLINFILKDDDDEEEGLLFLFGGLLVVLFEFFLLFNMNLIFGWLLLVLFFSFFR